MTEPSAQGFPGRRPLAAWWRQLAPWQPRHLWVGRLLIHRVEALASQVEQVPLDPIAHGVLRTLENESDLERLAARLRLDRQFLAQVLRGLQCLGLAEAVAENWTITAAGKQVIPSGAISRTTHQRRSFTFLEAEDPDQPCRYLRIDDPGSPWPADQVRPFAASCLESCLEQPPAWKQRHHFPEEVTSIVRLGGAEPESIEPWRRVMVDCPQILTVALADANPDRLLGFVASADDWSLATDPALELDEGWKEVFPELAADLPISSWQAAWEEWCQSRQLPSETRAPDGLELVGHRLRVRPLLDHLDRFRKKPDVIKGEAWILAGVGRFRRAALLEIIGEDVAAS